MNGESRQPVVESKKYILMTADILEGARLWNNGLHQNCLFLYKLFEAMGYLPVFIVGKKPTSDITEKYRIIDFKEYFDNQFDIYAFIEIGGNCHHSYRDKLKIRNVKLFKLFLGNILNVDIETPITSDTFINHHIPGSHGNMLISPHYHLLKEYTSAIYNIDKTAQIAPYVWDSVLIQDLIDTYKWAEKGPYSFTIMEPNISFQKCSLIPLMICEAYYRENPTNMDGVVVINGIKLTKSNFFLANILQYLDLKRDNRLFLIKRLTIREAAANFKNNIVICHAVNNDYNYLFLEYLYMGFPVIHNYEMLKDYGYYYKGNDIEAGKKMIDYVINTHGFNLESYRASCRQLIWKFSIHNPENITEWKNILEAEE